LNIERSYAILERRHGDSRDSQQIERDCDKMRIIIIEDDRAILKSLKKILELEGYEVDAAINGEEGEEGIRKCRSKQFDLALLDIRLPGMNGTEVLEVLHNEFPEMIKIMITGHPSLENAVASLRSGADAYLMKPVNPLILLKVINEKLTLKSGLNVRT